MLQSASASQLSAARFHFAGSSTFWPREARTGGKFGHEVVKANEPVRLSLLFCGGVPSQELTVFIQHQDASYSFMWAGIFFYLDWKDKRMSPHWALSGAFHEIWHDHGGPLAHQNQPTCIAALSVPPSSLSIPFLILPMGLQIFSPSWYGSCEHNRKFRKFLRCLDGRQTRIHVIVSRDPPVALAPGGSRLLVFCASGDITYQAFLDSLVILAAMIYFSATCRSVGVMVLKKGLLSCVLVLFTKPRLL